MTEISKSFLVQAFISHKNASISLGKLVINMLVSKLEANVGDLQELLESTVKRMTAPTNALTVKNVEDNTLTLFISSHLLKMSFAQASTCLK